MMALLAFCILLSGGFSPAAGLDNGVARTPPMGWMSWERFACDVDCTDDPEGRVTCISSKLYREMADLIVSEGYLDAGYEQVNIDDCWEADQRDANGEQAADPERFPEGIKGLTDDLHSKGVKLGLYSDIGTTTCSGLVGMKGNLEKDSATFASWGIDMLKVDGCNEDIKTMYEDYPALSKALNKTGRKIVFSCSWPAYEPHRCEGVDGCLPALQDHCNLWRNFNDISDNWVAVSSIIDFWKRNSTDEMVKAAGPGHWNDPDMLMVGNRGLSFTQEQTQFALWAIFAAPLLMSNDLRLMPAPSKEILLNKEIIAVNQDPLGQQGWCAAGCPSTLRVWVRPLHDGCYAAVLENRDSFVDGSYMTFSSEMVGWSPSQLFVLRDLYDHKDLPGSMYTIKQYVPTNSVVMWKVCKAQATEILV